MRTAAGARPGAKLLAERLQGRELLLAGGARADVRDLHQQRAVDDPAPGRAVEAVGGVALDSESERVLRGAHPEHDPPGDMRQQRRADGGPARGGRDDRDPELAAGADQPDQAGHLLHARGGVERPQHLAEVVDQQHDPRARQLRPAAQPLGQVRGAQIGELATALLDHPLEAAEQAVHPFLLGRGHDRGAVGKVREAGEAAAAAVERVQVQLLGRALRRQRGGERAQTVVRPLPPEPKTTVNPARSKSIVSGRWSWRAGSSTIPIATHPSPRSAARRRAATPERGAAATGEAARRAQPPARVAPAAARTVRSLSSPSESPALNSGALPETSINS